MNVKKCLDCKTEKPLTEFYIYKNRYYKSYCKPCNSARAIKYMQEHKHKKPYHSKKQILSDIVCDYCGTTFTPIKKWQKRCSGPCGYKFTNAKLIRPKRTDGNCARCNKSLAGKSRQAIYCSRSCSSMDHNFKHRAKTRTESTARRLEIFLRDKQSCYICNIQLSQKEFELDHLVPVSRGGSSDPTNLAVSCRFCNRSRGATIGIRQLAKLAELRP